MELKTSCIRHPPDAKFIIRRQYLVDACEEKGTDAKDSTAEVCAELLGQFEWHTNNPLQNTIFAHLIKQARAKKGDELKDNENWLPYSYSYLRELLFYSRGQKQIIKALERLERKGFIHSDVPKDISRFYSQNMSWFRLDVENLNALADAVTRGVAFQTVRTEGSKDEKKPARKTLDAIAQEIADFHRHINEIPNYVYNKKRLEMVRKVYSEAKMYVGEEKAFAQCILVILVNRTDDFYQGKSAANGAGKVFDWLEYIFSERKKFEIHLNKADGLGLTEEIAQREFETFKSGGTSRYAKRSVKEAVKAAEAQSEAAEARAPQEISLYTAFARKVFRFFADGKDAREVYETCMLEDEFLENSETLMDASYLKSKIVEACEAVEESLTAKQKSEIAKFSEEFANNNLINLEE